MGFFSKLLGKSNVSTQTTAADFLRGLNSSQRDYFVHQVNMILETITGYQEQAGASAILDNTACIFMIKGKVGTYGIVGNDMLIRMTYAKQLQSLVYFNNLKSFSSLAENPSDSQALNAAASEAAIYLLSGHIDQAK